MLLEIDGTVYKNMIYIYCRIDDQGSLCYLSKPKVKHWHYSCSFQCCQYRTVIMNVT